MSRLPFVLTLAVCGALFGWLFLNQDPPKKEKPRGKEKVRPVPAAPAPAAPVAAAPRIYGYPDPRGILLNLRERKGSCAGSRFRSQSPAFVLWDDGNIVSMSPTYDYRRSRVSIAQAESWSREFQSVAAGQTGIRCDVLRDRSARGDIISLQGRTGESGELTLSGPNIALVDPAHVAACSDCSALAPMARLLGEIDRERRHADQSRLPTEFPAEVYLEFRSCGCRNHPEIVNVSKEWPLPGARPEERCGRQSTRFRLDDPAQIRALSEAIARSAAVLDRDEIYTCFMRPLMEPQNDRSLARR